MNPGLILGIIKSSLSPRSVDRDIEISLEDATTDTFGKFQFVTLQEMKDDEGGDKVISPLVLKEYLQWLTSR